MIEWKVKLTKICINNIKLRFYLSYLKLNAKILNNKKAVKHKQE